MGEEYKDELQDEETRARQAGMFPQSNVNLDDLGADVEDLAREGAEADSLNERAKVEAESISQGKATIRGGSGFVTGVGNGYVRPPRQAATTFRTRFRPSDEPVENSETAEDEV